MAHTWKCTICGLVDGSDAPPAHCPECDARAAMFVESDEAPHGIPHNPIQPHDHLGFADFGPGDGTAGCMDEE